MKGKKKELYEGAKDKLRFNLTGLQWCILIIPVIFLVVLILSGEIEERENLSLVNQELRDVVENQIVFEYGEINLEGLSDDYKVDVNYNQDKKYWSCIISKKYEGRVQPASQQIIVTKYFDELEIVSYKYFSQEDYDKSYNSTGIIIIIMVSIFYLLIFFVVEWVLQKLVIFFSFLKKLIFMKIEQKRSIKNTD